MRAIAGLLFAVLVASCGKIYEAPSDDSGVVHFFNESSYSVSIHHSSFSGPVIVDKLPAGEIYSTTISPSNNYGVGSVFPIRYWSFFEGEWIGGTDPDPNAQIKQNIEAGKIYTIPIPQPTKLERAEVFLKILNSYSMPIEINRLMMSIYQVNGELPIPSGKTGIYKINTGEFKRYSVNKGQSTFIDIPEFTAKKGYIYSFEFDGTEVISKGEQEI